VATRQFAGSGARSNASPAARPGNVLIGLGANLAGPWGTPLETLRRALCEIETPTTRVVASSPVYRTEAVGQPGQPAYLNAVARLRTSLPPEALLRRLKALERRAGRQGLGRPWGPRRLDLDILDYSGIKRGWRGGRTSFARPGRRPLILPHPQMHRRSFVLGPLRDIAPDWRHPVLKRSAEALWRSLPEAGRGLRRMAPAPGPQDAGNP
jgi:2-amino-4-hydroxy-6-hydroxymethyldihydropteridine diphosphokinase